MENKEFSVELENREKNDSHTCVRILRNNCTMVYSFSCFWLSDLIHVLRHAQHGTNKIRGSQFGINFINPNIVQLMSEDDENWSKAGNPFNLSLIDSLIDVLEKAEKDERVKQTLATMWDKNEK
jgi:hypothetical protein